MAPARLLPSVFLVALACRAPADPPSHVPAGASADAPGTATVERRLALMGTWFDLEVEAGDRAAALAASERAVRAVEVVEGRLSTWREDTELARLNRGPVGEPVALSPELAHDLGEAARLWRLTGGAFDPGLGALVRAWGLRTGGRKPSAEELAAARAAGGFAAFELGPRTATRRHALAEVEEGGFGKGIALDAALAELAAAGATRACLDLGGQVASFGSAAASRSREWELADPMDRERPVLALRLGPGSLSTSGNSERGILVDGEPCSHLLDPVTGRPAPERGSFSVLAPDATSADALSTGLYVLGADAAFAWVAAHPGHELVVIEPVCASRRALASPGLRGRLRALVPELEIVFVDPRPSLRAAAAALVPVSSP